MVDSQDQGGHADLTASIIIGGVLQPATTHCLITRLVKA